MAEGKTRNKNSDGTKVAHPEYGQSRKKMEMIRRKWEIQFKQL